MSSCCASSPEQNSATGVLSVVLAGNPNSGKTTIFNALTGLRQKVGNYPGITVEKKSGRCQLPDGRWVEVVDLPGTYSLISRSPDELVAMEVLRGLRDGMGLPHVIIVVVDASNLQRNLYLVSQLIELGRPLVVALNMVDVAERRGIHVSCQLLEQQLGVQVIPVVGHKRQGIAQLKAAIATARIAPLPDWPMPQAMKEELLLVGGGLSILDSGPEQSHPVWRLGHSDDCQGVVPEAVRLDRYKAIAERLLIGDRATDIAPIALRQPVASMLASATQRMNDLGIDPMQAEIESHYRWIEGVAQRSIATLDELAAMGSPAPDFDHNAPPHKTWTERIDAVLIHKFWGLLIFALVMGALFVTIFWAARPVMDAIGNSIKWVGDAVTSKMAAGPLRAMIEDGIVSGVGTIVVFVPQIALLFLFLAILEDSGYLARAAFLMDRLLAKVGLHGKSFIPLLSSFACAIPGIMATRTIESRKDRLVTILVAPFMSCSARLPVYTLLVGTFFATAGPFGQAGIMLGLYAMGIIAAALMAGLFKRVLVKGPTPAFILEMPTYKMPQASQVARQVLSNTKEFLTKAGTTILCLSVVLWAMAYYPRLPAQKAAGFADEKSRAAAQLDYSIAGRVGHAMEGAIRPLGYNWKMGVGLVGAFAAREVFVSTMGVIYSVEETGVKSGGLSQAMRADRYPNGQPVWRPLVAVSLLVWFVLAMQCMSTLAVVRRETGSWAWPVFMLVYMNSLAYLLSLAVYQIGVMLRF